MARKTESVKQKSEYGFREFQEISSEGWSLAAFRASPDDVARALSSLPEFVSHKPNVGAQPMSKNAATKADESKRLSFTVQLKSSPWTIFFRTIHWATMSDFSAIEDHAAAISKLLATRALATASGGEEAALSIYDRGRKTKSIDDVWSEDPWLEKTCNEEKLFVPQAFIKSNPPQLMLGEKALNDVERVDFFELRVVSKKRGRKNPFTGEDLDF